MYLSYEIKIPRLYGYRCCCHVLDSDRETFVIFIVKIYLIDFWSGFVLNYYDVLSIFVILLIVQYERT